MVAKTTPASDVQPQLSLVTNIRAKKWASEFVLTCLDDPVTRRAYELVFLNCREIHWFSNEAESVLVLATEADVIGFDRGQAMHVEPAVLTTDLFELSILYGQVEIRELAGVAAQDRQEIASTRR
jgi:hypothetical protein